MIRGLQGGAGRNGNRPFAGLHQTVRGFDVQQILVIIDIEDFLISFDQSQGRGSLSGRAEV